MPLVTSVSNINTSTSPGELFVCVSDLLSEGGELEHVERLVEAGGVLVYINYHGDPASTTEEELQEVGQFGLPEGNMVLEPVEEHTHTHTPHQIRSTHGF